LPSRSVVETDRATPTAARAAPDLWRMTGVAALAVVVFSWGQFPMWMIGDPPSPYDGAGLGRHLSSIRNIVFTRILFDLCIYVALMLFGAGFRHLIRQACAECEWIGTLVFGAAAVWVGVTLVADGLEGGAALDAVSGHPDPSGMRALVEGTLLIYNGSIAFAITGLFLGAAGYATFASGILPRWTGWLAYASAALCAACIPAMYGGPASFVGYNSGAMGPAIVANFPPLIWFLVVGIVMIRKRRAGRAPTIRMGAGIATLSS
jgi:hypothetical protein